MVSNTQFEYDEGVSVPEVPPALRTAVRRGIPGLVVGPGVFGPERARITFQDEGNEREFWCGSFGGGEPADLSRSVADHTPARDMWATDFVPEAGGPAERWHVMTPAQFADAKALADETHADHLHLKLMQASFLEGAVDPYTLEERQRVNTAENARARLAAL